MIPIPPVTPDPKQLDIFGNKEERTSRAVASSGETNPGTVPETEAMSRSPTNEDECSLQVKEPDLMYQNTKERARALTQLSRALVLKNFQKQKDL